jgi:hypothetical protein
MSTLDHYISKLLSDQTSLEAFIDDPKGQSKLNHLSKADGSILRRCVSALPATSKSGLSIRRPLSSYRSSIRLLQNVLHNYHGQKYSSKVGEEIVYLPSILIYYNDTPGWTGAPVNDPHQGYVKHVYAYYKNNNTSARTIGEAMGFNPLSNPVVGDTVSGTLNTYGGGIDDISYTATYYKAGGTENILPFITKFVIDGISINIPLDGVTPDDRAPFWFYSINGNAIVPNPILPIQNVYIKNPDAVIGGDFVSFADYPLPTPTGTRKVNTITWQAIAPDMEYGFPPCTY